MIGLPLRAETEGAPWLYTLIHGATLTDDCPLCGRPTLELPMHGTFELRRIEENPVFTFYALENIDWTAGWEGGPRYRLRGRGEFQIGGEVALTQKLTLTLTLDDGHLVKDVTMTSEQSPVERLWPMMRATAKQTNGTPVQQLDAVISTAPFRDLWFSTAHGMTSGITPPPFEYYRNSEVLSLKGHRVKSNAELTQRLGIMPMVPDSGLDAMDVLPGGEIVFSTTADIFSESLGTLGVGDVLSNQGRIVRTHADLIKAFQPMPPAVDSGLDAVQAMDDDVIAFSVASEIFSERLGLVLGRGDLLSSAGRILKTNRELLARFHPVAEGGSEVGDLGLDALHIWPSGEVWFSTEKEFQDQVLGPVRSGDILSDSGYIVFGNLELVAPFSPLEDLADFGLDGLVVVTDALPALPAPAVTDFTLRPESAGFRLTWTGEGRFFQVLGAATAAGPYTPFSAVQSDPILQTDGWLQAHPTYFFRVRQW